MVALLVQGRRESYKQFYDKIANLLLYVIHLTLTCHITNTFGSNG